MLSGLEKRCNTLRYYTLHKLFLLGEAVLASAASNHYRLAAKIVTPPKPGIYTKLHLVPSKRRPRRSRSRQSRLQP